MSCPAEKHRAGAFEPAARRGDGRNSSISEVRQLTNSAASPDSPGRAGSSSLSARGRRARPSAALPRPAGALPRLWRRSARAAGRAPGGSRRQRAKARATSAGIGGLMLGPSDLRTGRRRVSSASPDRSRRPARRRGTSPEPGSQVPKNSAVGGLQPGERPGVAHHRVAPAGRAISSSGGSISAARRRSRTRRACAARRRARVRVVVVDADRPRATLSMRPRAPRVAHSLSSPGRFRCRVRSARSPQGGGRACP